MISILQVVPLLLPSSAAIPQDLPMPGLSLGGDSPVPWVEAGGRVPPELGSGGLWIDPHPDEVWARGESYKIGFDRAGCVYVPFLGADAPRTWPLRLRLAGVRAGGPELALLRDVTPSLEGREVRYERGPLVERYDLRVDGVEQTLLLSGRSGTGPLEVEYEWESELEGRADGPDLVFEGPLGHVRYSGAIVIDSRGRRVPMATSLEGGRIRLSLQSQEHAGLAYPLLIDPVLSTFSIHPLTPPDGRNPDVVRHGEHGRFGLVFERPFSSTDNDVFFLILDSSGAVLAEHSVDLTHLNWEMPSIGRHAGTGYLIVCSISSSSSNAWRSISSRMKLDSQSILSPVRLIQQAVGSTLNSHPAVGGQRSTSSAHDFCVVWQSYSANLNDTRIMYRMVGSDGVPKGNPGWMLWDLNEHDQAPSIAKWNHVSGSTPGNWVVAWHRWKFALANDLYAAMIRPDGTKDGAPVPLIVSSTSTRNPRVSSPTQGDPLTMIVYERGSQSNPRTWGFVTVGLTVLQHSNLSNLIEAPTDRPQIRPDVDAFRDSFVLAVAEPFPSSTLHGVHFSTLTWSLDRLHVAEARASAGASGQAPGRPRIASSEHYGAVLAAWHWSGFAPNPTLFGSMYRPSDALTFCVPGVSSVPSCPCNNPPVGAGRGCQNSAATGGARLAASGGVVPDTLSLTAEGLPPSAMSLLVQGNLHATGSTFGDGVRCVFGSKVLRMGIRTATNGVASWPSGSEPPLSQRSANLGDPIPPGTPRYYFVYYRDSDPAWACAATFNASSALRIAW